MVGKARKQLISGLIGCQGSVSSALYVFNAACDLGSQKEVMQVDHARYGFERSQGTRRGYRRTSPRVAQLQNRECANDAPRVLKADCKCPCRGGDQTGVGTTRASQLRVPLSGL